MSLTITNITKEKLPNHPYDKMVEKILGEKYDLSLTIVDADEIKQINKRFRNKNKPTDILSFPLTENSGEIFLCFSEAKKEASKFERDFDNFVAFLVIHGLVHLKGFDHSSTMESIEQTFRQEFRV